MRSSHAPALGLPCAFAALALSGCDDGIIAPGDAGVSEGGPDAAPGSAYTVVVLPDTQYYASSWPEIFMAQTRWIADNHATRPIAFVLHTGDVVDSDTTEQWTVAAQALHALDGLVPYVITAGNHDYGKDQVADRMGMGSLYFPPAELASSPWFQGTFEDGHGQVVHGGDGFLRLLHFPVAGHTVSVETYSPYLDRSLTGAANQFTIEVP